MTNIAARGVVLLALAGGGLGGVFTAAAVTATAASASAIADGPLASAPVSYECSLSGYMQGASPLSLSATVSAQSTITMGSALTIKVVTATAPLPSGMTSGMPAISDISASGTSQVTGGSVSLTGRSPKLGMPAGAMTQIPSITATGSVIPPSPGVARVYAPRSLLLLPANGSGGLAQVTCTTASVASVRITVTSGAGSTAAGGAVAAVAGAQAYRCAVTTPATTISSGEVLMRLRHSGPGAVGVPENVSLTSANGAFGGSLQGAATPTATAASLGLTGAYRGSIPLGLVPGSMQAGRVVLAGRWMPQMAGVFRLRAPHRFSVRLRTVQATAVAVVCTALTATSTTAVRVTASTAASRAAEQGFAATQGSAASSAKAPNTGVGGSLHSSSDVPLAAGGSAAFAAGLGIIWLALRRRRRANTV